MKLSVKARSGRVLIQELKIQGSNLKNLTVDDLCKAIHSQISHLHPSRQRLSVLNPSGKLGKPIVLERGARLDEYGVKDGDSVILKDLGPQVSTSSSTLTQIGWVEYGVCDRVWRTNLSVSNVLPGSSAFLQFRQHRCRE